MWRGTASSFRRGRELVVGSCCRFAAACNIHVAGRLRKFQCAGHIPVAAPHDGDIVVAADRFLAVALASDIKVFTGEKGQVFRGCDINVAFF